MQAYMDDITRVLVTPRGMENQMEKDMDSEVETRDIFGFIGVAM